MGEKRIDQIAVRVSPEMKKALQKEANKLDWSVSKLAERVLSDWLEQSEKNGGAIQFIISHNETININK